MTFTLDEEWVRYFASMYRVGMTPLVVSEARRAFYSGAAISLVLLMEASGPNRNDVAKTGEMISRLLEETKTFIRLQQAGVV